MFRFQLSCFVLLNETSCSFTHHTWEENRHEAFGERTSSSPHRGGSDEFGRQVAREALRASRIQSPRSHRSFRRRWNDAPGNPTILEEEDSFRGNQPRPSRIPDEHCYERNAGVFRRTIHSLHLAASRD